MIQSGWGDYEKTYMVVIFRDSWETKEFLHAIKDLYTTLRQHTHQPVNVIVDLRYSGIPTGSILSVITWSVKHLPDNANRIVVVSRSNLWKRLYQAVTHKRPKKTGDIIFVSSMDETYPLIITASSSS